MITLAFCQMFYFIVFKWTSLTGGDNGLHGVLAVLRPVDLNSEITLYFYVLILFLCRFHRLPHRELPFGRVLKALKDNEDRARSVGYDTTTFKTGGIRDFRLVREPGRRALRGPLQLRPYRTPFDQPSGMWVIMALLRESARCMGSPGRHARGLPEEPAQQLAGELAPRPGEPLSFRAYGPTGISRSYSEK